MRCKGSLEKGRLKKSLVLESECGIFDRNAGGNVLQVDAVKPIEGVLQIRCEIS
jgi:hypothetical protein